MLRRFQVGAACRAKSTLTCLTRVSKRSTVLDGSQLGWLHRHDPGRRVAEGAFMQGNGSGGNLRGARPCADLVERRSVCRAIGLLAATGVLKAAAQPVRILRVAWVSTDQRNSPSPNLAAFRQGMRDLGYVEGRNLAIEAWWGEGSGERVAQMTNDIVRSQPDVIVAAGGLAVYALIRAGVKLPIFFSMSAYPVEAKVVQSFARPGGNVTGISLFTLDLVGKRMQVLKEALPGIKRVAVIANPQHPGEAKERDAAQVAALALGLTLRYFPVQSEAELEAALTEVGRGRDEAVVAFEMDSRWVSRGDWPHSRCRAASPSSMDGRRSPGRETS